MAVEDDVQEDVSNSVEGKSGIVDKILSFFSNKKAESEQNIDSSSTSKEEDNKDNDIEQEAQISQEVSNEKEEPSTRSIKSIINFTEEEVKAHEEKVKDEKQNKIQPQNDIQIARLLKKHQDLQDKIEDLFDRDEERDVKQVQEEEQDVDHDIGAEQLYNQKLEDLIEMVSELINIENQIQGMMSDMDSANEQDQGQMTQLLDQKSKLTQSIEGNEAIIQMLIDGSQNNFVGRMNSAKKSGQSRGM